MSKTADEIVFEVFEEESFKNLAKDMSDADKKMIDESLRNFVDSFVLPLVNGFEAIAADPKASEELKKRLVMSQKDVVKPKG